MEVGYPDVPSFDVCTGVRADTLERKGRAGRQLQEPEVRVRGRGGNGRAVLPLGQPLPDLKHARHRHALALEVKRVGIQRHLLLQAVAGVQAVLQRGFLEGARHDEGDGVGELGKEHIQRGIEIPHLGLPPVMHRYHIADAYRVLSARKQSGYRRSRNAHI